MDDDARGSMVNESTALMKFERRLKSSSKDGESTTTF